MSQQPLNPIKVTAQAGDRENWATAKTRHFANHPPEEKEINQLKKALKDLVVFTNHHRGRTRHHPQTVPLHMPSRRIWMPCMSI